MFSLIPNPKCGPFDLRVLWQDSLRRTLFSRTIAHLLGMKEVEEPFSAALLQDFAIPLLAKAARQGLRRTARSPTEDRGAAFRVGNEYPRMDSRGSRRLHRDGSGVCPNSSPCSSRVTSISSHGSLRAVSNRQRQLFRCLRCCPWWLIRTGGKWRSSRPVMTRSDPPAVPAWSKSSKASIKSSPIFPRSSKLRRRANRWSTAIAKSRPRQTLLELLDHLPQQSADRQALRASFFTGPASNAR